MNKIDFGKYNLIDINTAYRGEPFPSNRGFAKIQYGSDLDHFFENAHKLSPKLIYHWNNGKKYYAF